MRARRPYGVILLSVIFLTVVIGMYIASTFSLMKGQFGVTRLSTEDRLAEDAARSGIQYALARLEEDPEWRGDGDGVVVDTPTLIVKESRGNVVGLITGSDGVTTQFRLRFNYQDGSGGGDALEDPDTDMRFDSSGISLNNLLEPIPSPLPTDDGTTATSKTVPPFSVAIVCEGRVADQFASSDAANINPSVDELQATRTIEALFRVQEVAGTSPLENAVSMAAGNIDVALFDGDASTPAALEVGNLTGEQAKIRGRGDINVNNASGSLGVVLGKDTELLLPTANSLNADLQPGVSRGDEDPTTQFYELAWSQVSDGDSSAAALPAGVYVYWESDGQLHYYPENFEDYTTRMITDPTFVVDPGQTSNILPAGLEFVPANQAGPDGVTSERHRFVVTNDVNVVSPSSDPTVVDLTIMPRGGAKEDIVDQVPTPSQTPSAGVQALFPAITPGGANSEYNLGIKQGIANNADWGNDGNITELLNLFGDSGTIINGNDTVHWNDPTLAPAVQNGNKDGLVADFLTGQRPLVGMANPNLELLEPVAGQVNTYQLKPGIFLSFLTMGNYTASDTMTEMDLESLSQGGIPPGTETLGPQDFEVTFAPSKPGGAQITSSGDIRLSTDVRGEGASIKSDGQIRLVGMGFDIEANPDAEGPSVSLYATDDIVISTLQPDADSGDLAYKGLDLKGIVYSWGDIQLKTGSADEAPGVAPQRVRLEGAMVAYGGEPGADPPGANGRGNIILAGDNIDLQFDPKYLLGLTEGGGVKVRLSPLSQATR